MGKRNKKYEKYEQDYLETSQEKPSLKLVLKVGGAPLTPDVASDTLDDGERRSRKKRRIIEKSDSEYESEVSQKWSQQNMDEEDDDESGRARAHREKKPAGDGKTPLKFCLEHLQKILQRKDVNGFFAFPVTDSIAPGYSNVIPKAMDFSTMRKNVDKGLYKSVAEYKNDYQLMMNNCMTYNHPDTIYHKEAKRLLAIGGKYMSKERLNQMRRNFAFMSCLTKEEIDLDDENSMENCCTESINVMERSSALKKDTKLELGKFEAIPDNMAPDEILQQVQNAAKNAADKLQTLAPNNKIGYLKKNSDGVTMLNILNPDNTGTISAKVRIVDLGGHVGRLANGSDSIGIPKEDKRNRITPVTYLNYGAFTSYAPVYDSSSANVDKEYSDLLLSTYGSETGLQYAKSLQHFVGDAGEYATSMVDDLLNVLTNAEHSQNIEHLAQPEQLKAKQKTESGPNGKINTPLNNFNTATTTTDFTSNNPSRQTSGASVAIKVEADETLARTSNLILSLRDSQRTRLSQDHLKRVDNCKPSYNEISLASQVTSELTQLIKSTTPGDVVGVKELRMAMGVTLDMFDGLQSNDLGQRSADEVSMDTLTFSQNGSIVNVTGSSGQQNQSLIQPVVGMSQLQDTGNLQTIEICNMQAPSQVSIGASNVQVIQGNVQDGTIMLDSNGQLIFSGGQFNSNTTQLVVGSNIQNPLPFTVINAHNSGQLINTGAVQVIQTNGQNISQPIDAFNHSSGNIFLQNDVSQLNQKIVLNNIQGGIQLDLNNLQTNNTIVQQPIYNTSMSFNQQLQTDQFLIQ